MLQDEKDDGGGTGMGMEIWNSLLSLSANFENKYDEHISPYVHLRKADVLQRAR
jgi:hypothetical protein